MPAFSWITYAEAKTELAIRLGDPSNIFWSDTELGVYLFEAMRVYNALCQYWSQDYAVDLFPPLSANWQSANTAGSPRQQTLTDTDIYTMIEYHLMESPTGRDWSGTNQFNITDIAKACSRRRNEILQVAACNMIESSIPVSPGTSVVAIPDEFLDVRRVRWVPVEGDPASLQRGDALSFQRYTPGYRQDDDSPSRWDVLGSPPQQLTLDTNVPVPGKVQVLGMNGAADFDPPHPSSLFLPDDWSWVLKFGAMADILSMEQEGKDLERAAYCRLRYTEGLKLMQTMPWVLQGFINNESVDIQPLAGADRYNYEWQSRATAYPEIVIGGIDIFALSPTPQRPPAQVAVTLKVVANAPVPNNDKSDIQVPRDAMAAILDEAQHLAIFKMGGAEAKAATKLHQNFVRFCLNVNARLRESGIFSEDLRLAVPRQDEQQERFSILEKE
jgi:hypothetical protein